MSNQDIAHTYSPPALPEVRRDACLTRREVGVGILSLEDYELLAGYFCDAKGDAGLRSPLGAELTRMQLAPARDAEVETAIEECIAIRAELRTASEVDDDRLLGIAARWRCVRERLARMESHHARVLEITFRWLNAEPLERRRRLARTFGGTAPLVVAHVGLADAELLARIASFSRDAPSLDPIERWSRGRRAAVLRESMEAVLAAAERAWIESAR
jgi:hypothetical protein